MNFDKINYFLKRQKTDGIRSFKVILKYLATFIDVYEWFFLKIIHCHWAFKLVQTKNEWQA